ncbi:MAG: response regulator [Alphaproteobacteria bacterium]|nr:response regulator [Alphaproteobacteria bacterium]
MSPAVLYVDDEQSNLTVFEAAFMDRFPVLTASNGHDAIELLRAHEVAVLLVDQRMPGMSGVELLARAREEFPDPVRILVTAYSNLPEAIDAINEGHIRRYLHKPWNHDELQATLLDAIEVYTVRKRLATLEQHMRQAERVYALGVVSAGVAHELRNPLMVLMGQVELARGDISDLPPVERSRVLHRLEAIHDNLVRVREIVEGMSMAHRRRDAEQQADLTEVVRLTVRSLQSSLTHRARTEQSLAALPPVRGSSTQLGQVVLNLLVNALQALPEDPGPSADHRVSITVRREGDHALLEVADTGPGIPADVQQRIFDPFFTTKTSGGTGLGLAITRQIVEELGGTISLDSAPGHGTRFRVALPLA